MAADKGRIWATLKNGRRLRKASQRRHLSYVLKNELEVQRAFHIQLSSRCYRTDPGRKAGRTQQLKHSDCAVVTE